MPFARPRIVRCLKCHAKRAPVCSQVCWWCARAEREQVRRLYCEAPMFAKLERGAHPELVQPCVGN